MQAALTHATPRSNLTEMTAEERGALAHRVAGADVAGN
jgi:uncharacterized membrane protein